MLVKKSDGINEEIIMSETENESNPSVILVERNDNVIPAKKLKQACLSFSPSLQKTPLRSSTKSNKRKSSSSGDAHSKCKLSKTIENDDDDDDAAAARKDDEDLNELNDAETETLNKSNLSPKTDLNNKRSQDILKRFLLTPSKDSKVKTSETLTLKKTEKDDLSSCQTSEPKSEENQLRVNNDTVADPSPCSSETDTKEKLKLDDSSADEKVLTDSSAGESSKDSSENVDHGITVSKILTKNAAVNKEVKKEKMKKTKAERDALKAKRIQEKEEKRKEKERLKEEKLKEQMKLKEEKLKEQMKLKEEKELKRKEEKERKLRQKEEALAKKKEIQEQKEQEKLQKEEERKRKLELIEAKQEKRRRSELEKSLREEEETRKKEKEKAVFASFFVKKDVEDSQPQNENYKGLFKPFEVKENMKLAPLSRVEVSNHLSVLEENLKLQNCSCLYLEELRIKALTPGHSNRTLSKDDDVQIIDENEVVVEPKVKPLHPKLLFFHENTRPPYWGTWQKKSQLVSPRNPFNKDEKYFDYEVDSDEEWEEEEPGESLSATEDEKESEDEYEVDNDFFVPHGYLSQDEENDDDAEVKMSPDTQQAKLKLKEREFEEEMKTKCKQIKPRVFGCFWNTCENKGLEEVINILETHSAVVLVAVPITVQCIKKNSADDLTQSPKSTEESISLGPLKPVPEEAMPFLIQLLHGNSKGLPTIMNEFQEFWKKYKSENSPLKSDSKDADGSSKMCNDDPDKPMQPLPTSTISKRQLKLTIKKISKRDVWPEETEQKTKQMWYVDAEIREKYKLSDLSLPNQWKYVTKPAQRKNKNSSNVEKTNALNASFNSNETLKDIATPSTSRQANIPPEKETVSPSLLKTPKSCKKNNMSISKFLLPRHTSPENTSNKTINHEPVNITSITKPSSVIDQPPSISNKEVKD